MCPAGSNWRKQLVLIIGSSFAGKTHWLRHLFQEIHKQFHYGVVFSSTDQITNEYNWMPRENKYDSWEDKTYTVSGKTKPGFRTVINNILLRQAQNIKKLGALSPHIFVIIDDPLGNIDFHHSKEFQVIAGQLRKYNTSLFIICQYVKYLSPLLRNGCHKLVVFSNTEEDLLKVKELVIGFRQKKHWMDFIIKATQNYGGVIYDRVNRDFYTFRAPAWIAEFMMYFF